MKGELGTSYECPLVLDDCRSTRRDETSPKKKRAIICIDMDDDRKMPAKTAKTLRLEQDDEGLAARLQAEEWENQSDDDALLAVFMHAEEGNDIKHQQELQADASLAAFLHKQEVTEKEARKEAEDESMNKSLDGRAWLFVNQVLDLSKRLATLSPGLTVVSVDDMVFLAKRFIKCHADFQANGWPLHVSLAYHYTKNNCMDSIKQDGLMTLADRRLKGSNSTGVGAFGDGVYTATNPYAFYAFGGGTVGLLVATLLGNTKRVPYQPRLAARDAGINSVVGNKCLRQVTQAEEAIPEATKFHDELGTTQFGPIIKSSKKLLDHFFNGGTETVMKQILPSAGSQLAAHLPPQLHTASLAPFITQTVPSRIAFISNSSVANILAQASTTTSIPQLAALSPHVGVSQSVSNPAWPSARIPVPASVAPRVEELVTYEAPKTLLTSLPSDVLEACAKAPGSKEDCAICMDHLHGSVRVVRLKLCGHEYHRTCIKDALKADPKCPVCRRMVQKPQGRSPSGTMTIATSPVKCSGFESCARSIFITYYIPSGIQKSYHDNPGQRYQGTTRNAYLPDNEDGRKPLKRLKNALIQGFMFIIGTSLRTRQPNSVTWASIHHKTSPSSGPHGFPDPRFLANCNQELDSLGVPK